VAASARPAVAVGGGGNDWGGAVPRAAAAAATSPTISTTIFRSDRSRLVSDPPVHRASSLRLEKSIGLAEVLAAEKSRMR